jgi:1-acyl-sn-glycerol-3-phosphate acyltransferase
LAPLRLILFQIFFWAWSALINIAWLPSLLMPRWVVAYGMEIWARVAFQGLKYIVGLDYEVRGRENVPAGPVIFAAKHLSMWETIAQHIVLKDPATVMKSELLSIPFYGWYARKCEMIIVDREGHASALRNMLKSTKDCLAAGRPVVIFPEGTRKLPGDAPDYKPGVAALYSAAGVPCVPVALNSGLFWSRKGIKPKPGKIILEFLPPIPPGLKRQEFMAQLQRQLEDATGRLLLEASFKAPDGHSGPA